MAHFQGGIRPGDGEGQPMMLRKRTSRVRLSIDPKEIRSMAVYGQGHPKVRHVEKFAPEMVEECRDLFNRFDKSGDNELDRAEFGTMMRTLGLDLREAELDRFFQRMDRTGNGEIEFEELIEFLEEIAQPLTLEEELSEAFWFFSPEEVQESSEPSSDEGSDSESGFDESESSDDELRSEEEHCIKLGPPGINAKGLAQALTGMGEDITEEECGDMIAEATGGKKYITFEQFRQWSKPDDRPRSTEEAVMGRVARMQR